MKTEKKQGHTVWPVRWVVYVQGVMVCASCGVESNPHGQGCWYFQSTVEIQSALRTAEALEREAAEMEDTDEGGVSTAKMEAASAWRQVVAAYRALDTIKMNPIVQAAPELLAAAKNLLRTAMVDGPYYDDLRAAIAKAEVK